MRRSFWLLFWFNFCATWNAALLTALFDWKAGWLFAIAMGGAFFLIWKYDPEKILRRETEDQNDNLRKVIYDLTDRCLDEHGHCRMCTSKHVKLSEYPFDYRLHQMHCPIPRMRMTVQIPAMCSDAEMFAMDESSQKLE